MPLSVFRVNSGNRYRFRVVSNGFAQCMIEVSIDSHLLTVIATDTEPVVPQVVKSFFIGPGERYLYYTSRVELIGTIGDWTQAKTFGISLIVKTWVDKIS